MRNNKKEDFVDMKEVLKNFKTENNLQKGFDKVDVNKAWEQVMGPGISNYTTHVRFDNGTLLVSLSSSVLRQELLYGRSKIVENLNEHLGKELIQKIILR